MCTVPVLDRICRESYNDPDEVYETLKRRAWTGDCNRSRFNRRCRAFAAAPRFLPERRSDVYHGERHGAARRRLDIAESDHIELQRRRDDLPSLIAYLDQRRLLYSVNHVFSSLTGPRNDADFEDFVQCFRAVETLNGQMLARANRHAAALCGPQRQVDCRRERCASSRVSGKHVHEVRGARNRHEFLEGLKLGPRDRPRANRQLLES